MSASGPLATTREEQPVYFQAGKETLFGVFTRPTVDPLGIAVVVLPGVGFATMVNRNRLAVRLCRRLAALGYHTMRIDYQGVGESTGAGAAYVLERPFTEDLRGALRWLEGQGLRRLVLVGTCFGAWTALVSAKDLPQVEAAVLVSVPSFVEDEMAVAPMLERRLLRRRLRGLLDARRRSIYLNRAKTMLRARLAGAGRRGGDGGNRSRWVRPEFFESLDALVRREAPVLLLYGTEDKEFKAFDRARPRVDPVLRVAAGLVDLEIMPGQVHGLPDLEVQEQVLDLLVGWIDGHRRETPQSTPEPRPRRA